MSLTRDQILNAQDLPVEELDVPEWGGIVRLKSLNGEQREEIEIRSHKAKTNGDALGWKGLKALVATFAIVDETGQQVFGPNDVAVLGKKSSAALDRIFEHVVKANALRPEDAEALAGN